MTSRGILLDSCHLLVSMVLNEVKNLALHPDLTLARQSAAHARLPRPKPIIATPAGVHSFLTCRTIALSMTRNPEPPWLDLYDWRKHVAAMYAEREAALLRGENELEVLTRFRAQKDILFTRHPQSP